MNKNTVIATLVVLLLGGGVWYFSSHFSFNQDRLFDGLSGVVAKVNGEEISRTEFDEYQARSAAQQGFGLENLAEEFRDEFEAQAMDSLISHTLLRQAAENSGIAVEQSEIDDQITEIKNQFENEEIFKQALSAEGLSEDELRAQVSEDLTIQKYLEQELSLLTVEVTEEEIIALYDEVATGGGDIPPLSEVRDQVEEAVIRQKQQKLVGDHIQELREKADIEIFI